MSSDQEEILREALAYRFPRWTIGVIGGRWMLEMRATLKPSVGSRPIWGPHLFGTGTYTEMNKLRQRAMTAYNRLTAAKEQAREEDKG